jgi:Pathogenicity locus
VKTRPIDRSRAAFTELEQLPNIGTAVARDLRAIGVRRPAQLAGRDPWRLYARVNRVLGARQDPCLLDTFIAVVRFMEGAPARPWWHYTPERKRVQATRASAATRQR